METGMEDDWINLKGCTQMKMHPSAYNALEVIPGSEQDMALFLGIKIILDPKLPESVMVAVFPDRIQIIDLR
jgi:hypothetical protein